MSDRFSVPLVMLPHNIKALLKAEDQGEVIPCNGIGLRHDPESANGVILVIRMDEGQKEIALENFGFKARSFADDGGE
jgi:hypothetical protein